MDTSFWVAMSNPRDKYHVIANIVIDRLKAERVNMLTTHAVLLEVGNALARAKHRKAAVKLLISIEEDPALEIVTFSESLYQQAKQLYISRPDKEWGLTDCLSFVVMQQRGVTAALTTDVHFRQAGFRALLLDDIYDY